MHGLVTVYIVYVFIVLRNEVSVRQVKSKVCDVCLWSICCYACICVVVGISVAGGKEGRERRSEGKTAKEYTC